MIMEKEEKLCYFCDLSIAPVVAKADSNGKWKLYRTKVLGMGSAECGELLLPDEFDEIIPYNTSNGVSHIAVFQDEKWKFIQLVSGAEPLSNGKWDFTWAWLEVKNMTQAQVNTAVNAFIQNFIDNPYLHRTEHSLHIALFEELFQQFPQTFEFYKDDKNNQIYNTNFVHKEFPGRKKDEKGNQSELVDRTQIDIVVLKKQQAASIDNFLDGNLAVDFAFEMSLEAGIEHLCWDIFKFITGSNKSIGHKNYIIHLYHKKHAFKDAKIDKYTMGNGGKLEVSDLTKELEWCYYLIRLCIKYSQKQDNDDYEEIIKIIKDFVWKKNEIKWKKNKIEIN
jgi:hypothetical protein